MEFTEYLPFWNQLTSSQQLEIQKEISFAKRKKERFFTTDRRNAWVCF